jgi:CRISPR system Cascade subunit CasC
MSLPRFLQIHSLHSYTAALINRDDSGWAKRLPFGGATRTRISSQCLKRHWRIAEGTHALSGIEGATEAYRSREVVGRLVTGPLKGTVPDDVLVALEAGFNKHVYGDKGEKRESRQPLLLGAPEIAFLAEAARKIAESSGNDAKAAAKAVEEWHKDEKNNLKAMREQGALNAGLAAALFGRMVTSDPDANIDAPIHVAHAFTVHDEEIESDYFSVVDDLAGENDTGADHIGETELTSGLFYGYVVVDVPALVSNLTGVDAKKWEEADREMAAEVVRRLVHLIAEVSPGAKLGSTAPYGYADFMLIEAGDRQPRSLANAFRTPCEALVPEALKAMSSHLGKLDVAYDTGEARRFMSLENTDMPKAVGGSLPALADWAAGLVREGKAA